MMWILLIVMGIVSLGLAALYIKQRIITNQLEKTLVLFGTTAEYLYREITAIDIRGSFEADDEIGVIFREIQKLVTIFHSVVIFEELPEDGGGQRNEAKIKT